MFFTFYRNNEAGGFSEEGITSVISRSNREIECVSNHLTSFAVLVSTQTVSSYIQCISIKHVNHDKGINKYWWIMWHRTLVERKVPFCMHICIATLLFYSTKVWGLVNFMNIYIPIVHNSLVFIPPYPIFSDSKFANIPWGGIHLPLY